MAAPAPSRQTVITTPPLGMPAPPTSTPTTTRETKNGSLLGQLESVEGFQVQLLTEPVEHVFDGKENRNRYEVLDPSGQRISFATRNTDICNGCGCVKAEPLIQWLSSSGNPVLNLSPRYGCTFVGCGLMVLDMKSITGAGQEEESLGTVTRIEGCFPSKLELRDEAGRLAFVIRGALCGDWCGLWPIWECSPRRDFRILLPDGVTEVGLIQQQTSTKAVMSRGAFSFQVSFSTQPGPKLKALIMAAVFVIDDAYFGLTPQGHPNSQKWYPGDEP